MKKSYTKPIIAVEHYILSQTIASCVKKIGSTNSDCVLRDPNATPEMKDFAGVGYFMPGSCDISSAGMSDEDGFCYHTSINATFTS